MGWAAAIGKVLGAVGGASGGAAGGAGASTGMMGGGAGGMVAKAGGGGGGGKKGGNAIGGLMEKLNGNGASSLAIGGIQAIVGMRKKKKADAMLPSMEDTEQRAMKNYISRRRRAFETGTANTASRTALRQAMQSGVSNSFKYGASTRGLNAMNQMYLNGLLGLNEQGINTTNQLIQQESQAVDNIAQRKLDLGMTKYDREQARAAQLMQQANQNMGVGLAKIMKLNQNPTAGQSPAANAQ